MVPDGSHRSREAEAATYQLPRLSQAHCWLHSPAGGPVAYGSSRILISSPAGDWASPLPPRVRVSPPFACTAAEWISSSFACPRPPPPYLPTSQDPTGCGPDFGAQAHRSGFSSPYLAGPTRFFPLPLLSFFRSPLSLGNGFISFLFELDRGDSQDFGRRLCWEGTQDCMPPPPCVSPVLVAAHGPHQTRFLDEWYCMKSRGLKRAKHDDQGGMQMDDPSAKACFLRVCSISSCFNILPSHSPPPPSRRTLHRFRNDEPTSWLIILRRGAVDPGLFRVLESQARCSPNGSRTCASWFNEQFLNLHPA